MLEGRRAIVTGAASGIGLAAARRFAAEGAAVLLVDIADGESEAARLRREGARAWFLRADLADPQAASAVRRHAVGCMGGIDVLMNNAGVIRRADPLDLSLEDFEATLAVNLRAPFLLTQQVGRVMREAGQGGSIINMSSVNALLNIADSLAYSVSKGALNQLTRGFAIGLAPYAIRVNAIGPGTIETPMAVPTALSAETLAAVEARTPLGRLGQPDEIAAIAAFLASDESSYVTGQTIYADGGRLALNYTMAPRAGRKLATRSA
jgi:NAD(P)-dependent dehydrogenase (short-subunit alcohol dehydrogenase family)